MAFVTNDIIGRSELMTTRGTNGMVIHSSGGTLDSVKEWLDKRSVANIPNKYLVAGAALAGLAYYGYRQRWF